VLVIGADPGQSGAQAILDWRGDLVLVADLPYIRNGRTAFVDSIALQEAICGVIGTRPARAIVERVSAMPKQGVASSFAFGTGYGSLLGVLRSMAYPIELAAPSQWKREMGLSSDKQASLNMARLRFPQADLRLQKHEGRAEALLLAMWALNRRPPAEAT
jgi:hypothetical protein